MELPNIINWTSPLPFKGLLGGIFQFYSNFNITSYMQTVKTMIRGRHSMGSDLGLYCLTLSHKNMGKDQTVILVPSIFILEYIASRVHSSRFTT